MSNHTNRDNYNNPNYFHRHVGGKINPINKNKYIESQSKLIERANSKLPFQPNQSQINNFNKKSNNISRSLHGEYNNNYNNYNNNNNNISNKSIQNLKDLYFKPNDNRFDPYIGFLHDKGLIDIDNTNKRRYKTEYLDINSKFRKTEPITIKENIYLLNQNPIKFTQGSNLISITHNNNEYIDGDLISLSGIKPSQYIIRTFDGNNQPSFIIPAGCNFMKVFFKHNLPSDYNNENALVEFSGILGDRGGNNLSGYLGNIPTNILNQKFPIRVSLSGSDLIDNSDQYALTSLPSTFLDYSVNHFFVVLPKVMQLNGTEPPYSLKNFNYIIKFLYISGIPINLLNADYPITPDRRQGYHIIKNVTNFGYDIEIPLKSISTESNGGITINVARIGEIKTGYPDPNKYTIDLERTYNNVVSARLLSIEFPNTEQVVKKIDGKINNKIYWNDIDDGDVLYNIELPAGNYTPEKLSSTLEELFFATPRISQGNDNDSTYTLNHYIQVSIDTVTDLVTFSTYKEYILLQPFSKISPEISINSSLNINPADTEYEITILHPRHGLTSIGQRILISDAIDHLGIPSRILNTEHNVIEIIDLDNYKIKLPRFNLLANRSDTKGGVSVKIYVPNLFRLRFDQPDSMAELLGFRNPGDINSITKYSSVITNNDPYVFDTDINTFGQINQISNNSIQLGGDNYVLMAAKPLTTLNSIGPKKDVFAKIQLCDLPGRVLFNSHVNTSKNYEDPINKLSELEIEFYTPDGFLFDFNGVDHSFTIELTTVHDIPNATHINASTGINYNVNNNR